MAEHRIGQSHSRLMAGADLITTCLAIADPRCAPYLSELGVSVDEQTSMPVLASKILEREHDLLLTYENVERSPAMAELLLEPMEQKDVRAINVLLDISITYVASHDERQLQSLWTTRVFGRLNSKPDEPSSMEKSARLRIAFIYGAYRADRAVVSRILEMVDRPLSGDRGSDQMGLEILATLIGRRSFLRFAARLRRVLSESELQRFLDWASSSGVAISMPRSPFLGVP